MNKTIWIVSELFAPDDAATAHLMTQIAEGLVSHGATEHDSVAVLCAQPTYTSRGQNAAWTETRQGVKIRRLWSTTFPKDRLVLRAINVATIVTSFFFSMLFRFRRGDHVLVVTNPPPLPFVASIAARIRGARIYLLIHDVYPDVLVPTGFTKEDSIPYRVIQFFTRRLYHRVDRIITIGRDMRKRVIAKSPELANKTLVIPNWADADLGPVPENENRLLEELPWSDKFVIQYSGNMGRTHGLNVIAEAAAILEQQGRSEIQWMICGWGGGKLAFKEKCQTLDLKSVAILDPFPREKLAELISVADVSIISFIPGMSGISVPSRMYNILAVGSPLIGITEPDSELALTILDDNLGWISAPEGAEGLAALIIQIFQHRHELVDYHQRCIEAAKRRFSKTSALEQYREVLYPSKH